MLLFKKLKEKITNYLNPAKKYRLTIIADSTNTPTMDCSIEDILAIQKGAHGLDYYEFQGQGCKLVISKK